MALCNVFVERILPEIDHNHYFGIIQRKAIFWKICFRKNLPMGVCHTQGYIVQPPNLRFFGHSSLTLSKYGGGVFNWKEAAFPPKILILYHSAAHRKCKGPLHPIT